MAQEVSLIIRLKDRVTRTLRTISARFRRMAATAGAAIGRAAGFLVNWRTAMIATAATVGVLGLAIKKAFQFETLETQFAILLKSTEAAKARMEELAAFSATTPFQLPDIAEASRQLTIFSGGLLGSAQSMLAVGDAAAATGRPIQEVAFWIGRAIDAIKSGRPFGEAAMRLQEMGILTGEARAQMEDLQKSGADNIEVWDVLTDRLAEFEGGMAKLSQTGAGLESTLRDNVGLVLKDIGEIFVPAAKRALESLIETLQKLREDGTLIKWADRIIRAFELVERGVKATGRDLSDIAAGIRGPGDTGPITAEEVQAAAQARQEARDKMIDDEFAAWKKADAKRAADEKAALEGRAELERQFAEGQAKAAAKAGEKRAKAEYDALIKESKTHQKELLGIEADRLKAQAAEAVVAAKKEGAAAVEANVAAQAALVGEQGLVGRRLAAMQLRRDDPAAFRAQQRAARQEDRRERRQVALAARAEELQAAGGRLTPAMRRAMLEVADIRKQDALRNK
ncbi:MAG: hypothetical protein ACTSX8_01605, partial [Alphaproteobacteria bacterium]